MKCLSVFVATLCFILLSSTTPATKAEDLWLDQGQGMPNFIVDGIDGENLELNFNKRAVVSFWKTTDGQSRVNNQLLHNALKENNSDVQFISISLDENENIWKRTVQMDKLEADQSFRLEGGDGIAPIGYLINADGTVAIGDLTPEQLRGI